MKRIFKQTLAFASLALLSSVAAAGIADTPHNLSSTGAIVGQNKFDGTAQICVFCHTPHAADTTAAAPLWNKAIPLANTYTTYDALNTSSLDGEILAVGSVSAACLSCHDGTQAMDNMVNAPGSGSVALAGTWSGANQTGGKITGAFSNLGADLRNDHPIGIEYCGGGLTGSGATASGTCADSDFVGVTAAGGKVVSTKIINTKQVFWVDTTVGTAGTREKTDLALYTRDFAGAAGTPSVECASCHDPHVSKTDVVADVNFMRVTTAGSAICLACHVK